MSKFVLKPFKDMIALSKEKLDEAMAPIRAMMVQSQASLEMAKIDAEILNRQTEVQELCVDKEVKLNSIIDKLDRIALLERRKEQFADIVKQLFPS